MKLLKLTLHKCNRFMLCSGETITYTPDKQLQIILGRNGSGKSSLLELMYPPPVSVKKYFNDGGYRVVSWEHNDHVYEMTDGYDIGKHTFRIDEGPNLNTGGGIVTQRQLVLTTFGLDSSIVNILIGASTFSSMNNKTRRHWLSLMGSVNCEYPMAVYNKVKKDHRDMRGAVVMLNKKIEEIKDGVIGIDMLNELKSRSKRLKALLDDVRNIKRMDLGTQDVNLLKKLDGKVKEYNEFILKDLGRKDVRSVELETASVKTSINLKLNNIELIEIGLEDTKGNSTKLKELEDKLLQQKGLTFIDIEQCQVNEYNCVNERIKTIMDTLVGCGDILSNITNLRTTLGKVDKRIEDNVIEIDKLAARIDIGENGGRELMCDVCGVVTPHSTPDSVELSTLKKRNIELGVTYNELKDYQLRLTAELGLNERKRALLMEVCELLNIANDSKLEVIYDSVNDYDVKVTDINRRYEYSQTLRRVDDLKEQQARFIEENELKLNTELNKLKSLFKRLTLKHTSLNMKLKEYTEYNERVDYRNNLIDEIHTIFTTLRKFGGVNKRTIQDKVINELLVGLVSLDADIHECIRVQEGRRSTLEDHDKTLATYTKEVTCMQDILTALCPVNGAIGEMTTKPINDILSEINDKLTECWSYPVELLPVVLSDEESMDYKFKVRIDNNPNSNLSDVDKLSTATKTVVNTMFKEVCVRRLGLKQVPICYDELGGDCDSAHREKLMDFIESKLRSSPTRIFMTSHHVSMYGRFKSADMVVLGKDGVELSDGHNLTITIT